MHANCKLCGKAVAEEMARKHPNAELMHMKCLEDHMIKLGRLTEERRVK